MNLQPDFSDERIDRLNTALQDVPEETRSRLREQLIAWIQTPSWEASEAFLREHQANLLTDAAEAVLFLLLRNNPDKPEIGLHLGILQAAREHGVAAAYAALSAQRKLAALA